MRLLLMIALAACCGIAGAQGAALPEGALMRLGTPGFKHTHTVACVRFSRDGSRVVTASWDKTARVWDAKTGREICRFTGHREGVSSCAISDDLTVAASGDMKRTLVFWDARTGRELARHENQENTVIAMALAPDGRTLATSSVKAVRVWDMHTQQMIREHKEEGMEVRPVEFSSDGTLLMASGASGIWVWDAKTGAEIRRVAPPGAGSIFALASQPNGSLLATRGDDHKTRLWDTRTWREVRQWDEQADGSRSLRFTPDGKSLALGSNGKVVLRDVKTGAESGRFTLGGKEDCWMMSMAFSPDGATLATAGTEHAVRMWDVAKRSEVADSAGHRGPVRGIAFVSAAKDRAPMIVTGGDDSALCWWDLSGKELARVVAYGRGMHALAGSRDGRVVASAGSGKSIHFWNVAEQKEQARFQADGGIDNVAVSRDGSLVAAAGWQDRSVRLFDPRNGVQVQRILLKGVNYADMPLAVSPDGRIVVSGSSDRTINEMYGWDAKDGRLLWTIQAHAAGDRAVAFSPDGATVAISRGNRIELYEAMTGKLRRTINGDNDAGTCIAFSPDGRRLAAGGGPDKPTLRVWDVRTGDLVGNVVTGHDGWLTCVAFSEDGKLVATGSQDTTALVWELEKVSKPVGAIPAEPVGEDKLAGCWADLGRDDAAVAYAAVLELTRRPEQAIGLIMRNLDVKDVAPDSGKARRWITELSDASFRVRQDAQSRLAAMGAAAAPAMREALGGELTEDARHRIELLLGALQTNADTSPAAIRDIRAIEALELMCTEQSQAALAALAEGDPDRRVTRLAKGALSRSKR